jgi:hypothetical protein
LSGDLVPFDPHSSSVPIIPGQNRLVGYRRRRSRWRNWWIHVPAAAASGPSTDPKALFELSGIRKKLVEVLAILEQNLAFGSVKLVVL